MTRKDFLRAAVGVAASAFIPGLSAAAPAPKSQIERGVILYSYQEEFYIRTMTLEDCLGEVADIGANCIELVAEEMIPGFPNPSDRWVDQWRGWVDKYHIRSEERRVGKECR